MSQWEGKSRGNKLGYQIFVFVCKKTGLKPAYFLLRFVSLYFVVFLPNARKQLYSYFRKRHHYSRIKSILHVYRNFYVFGQTLLDKIIVLSGIKNPFTFYFDGVENLKEIVSRKQGGILLSAHVGNWEIASQMLQELRVKVNVVMYDGEHKQIKNYLHNVTTDRAFNIIVIRNDLSHVYEIGQALQKNELVCMHADRFINDTKTVTLDFLGSPARFPLGPFSIASIFNVPVSIVYGFKETNTHYHFYGSKYLQRRQDESKEDYRNFLAQQFVKSLEEMMYKYPTQWFNYYNFWESTW